MNTRTASRKRKQEENVQVLNPNTLKKRRQRANIRSDPIRLEKARKADRERKRISRAAKREHLKQHPRLHKVEKEKKKLEMRSYREKLKKNQPALSAQSARSVAAKKREDKKKDRKRKHEQATHKKYLEEKKKRASQRVKTWRLTVKLKACAATTSDGSDTESEKSPFSTKYSEKHAVCKAKKSLPDTPRRKLRVLQKLITSPSSKKALESKQAIPGKEEKRAQRMAKGVLKSLSQQLDAVKYTGGSSSARRAANKILKDVINKSGQYGVKTALRKMLKVRKNLKTSVKQPAECWQPRARKTRKDSIPETVKERVKAFYLSPDISREVPDKRSVIKIKDQEASKVLILPRHNMSRSIQEAFDLYKQSYPDDKLGFTSFHKLRPKQVKKLSETNRRTCLCQKCCNAALKAEALQKFAKAECTAEIAQTVITVKHDVIKATLCNYESEYPRKVCLERLCKECSAHLIADRYGPIVEQNKGKQIKWNKWEQIAITKDGNTKKVISCVTKDTSLEEFLDEYVEDMQELPIHVFRATWQHKQMKVCIEGLANDEACLCMDYAENYQCKFQQEVQSAFFEQNQVTIHPMMAYYKEDFENETLLVKHGIIGVTDDHQKGACGVKDFEDAAVKIIEREKGAAPKQLHEFTDGCASQYKGKVAFFDISQRKNCEVTRNFFETSHGKSVCDGLGAVVKGSCYQAVLSGNELISNARAVMNYCKKKLQIHHKIVSYGNGNKHITKREFYFSRKEDVNKIRPDVKTLPGTRKLHSVRSTGQETVLNIRSLSCYCEGCKQKTQCQNSEYITPWEQRSLKLAQPCETQEDPQEDPAPVDTEERVSIGDFVAVKLCGKKSSTVYMAEVLDLAEDGEEAHLRYMKKCGGELYVWPNPADES